MTQNTTHMCFPKDKDDWHVCQFSGIGSKCGAILIIGNTVFKKVCFLGINQGHIYWLFHQNAKNQWKICDYIKPQRFIKYGCKIPSIWITYVFTSHVKFAWWRHQMEPFSALMDLCAGNSPVTGEFPAQRAVTRNFDVFFDLRLNKRLSE